MSASKQQKSKILETGGGGSMLSAAESGGGGRYMTTGHNTTLLLELVNKDPESYEDEFTQKFTHYQNLLHLMQIDPENIDDRQNEELGDLVYFLSTLAHHYPKLSKQISESMIKFLERRSELVTNELRMAFCKAIVVLRNRSIIPPMDALRLFMELVKCNDKELRKFLFGSIISYLKKLNVTKKDQKIHSALQQFLYAKLRDSRTIVVRTALLLLVAAYRKNIWSDARTANALAECCFHKVARIQVTSLKFLLGSRDDEQGGGGDRQSDSDTDDEYNPGDAKSLKQVMVGYRVGKKTNKRKKHMEMAKKNISKELKKKKSANRTEGNVRACLQLYDPQSFAERLMSRLETKAAERFEVRLLVMALTAKLIGVHRLQLLAYYSYIQRYMKPQQREVTRILMYAAQASHEMVPPESIESLLRCLAQNFVTDRNSSEAITVGLNTARAILANCPFAVDGDTIRDLTAYKSYKNKNVSMAARSLIALYRTENPHLLHRKDRGQTSVARKEHEPIQFGVATAKSSIDGAEVLVKKPKSIKSTIDISSKSESLIGQNVDQDQSLGSDEEDDDSDIEEIDLEEQEEENEEEQSEATTLDVLGDEKHNMEQDQASDLLSSGRILGDADFKRMARFQLKKISMPVNAKKRKLEEDQSSESSSESSGEQMSDVEEDNGGTTAAGLTSLQTIMHMHKKPRRDTKAERMASIAEGREGREKFGKPKEKGSHVGRTNAKLARNKAYMMVKQKARGKKRQRSFHERQRSLKNALKQQQGRKRH